MLRVLETNSRLFFKTPRFLVNTLRCRSFHIESSEGKQLWIQASFRPVVRHSPQYLLPFGLAIRSNRRCAMAFGAHMLVRDTAFGLASLPGVGTNALRNPIPPPAAPAGSASP